MQKRWIVASVVGAAVVGGVLVTAKGGDKASAAGPKLPFRLGQVQQQDLQVSVREVGTVDPFTKVDVKATVSGRIVGMKVREGDVVKTGQVLAEVEPDVVQAQSLSEVQGGLSQAQLRFKDADRLYNTQRALFDQGLIGREAFKDAKASRDLAEDAYKAAQTKYQIVEDRGIPISGNASTQIARVTSPMNGVVIKKGVELGDTITSGVSSFNAGTVVYTVADLKSLIIRVNLNEVDIAKVRVGLPVRITLDAYPQKAFTGKVRFVAPAAELQDKIKVFKVEIALDDLSDAYRTGMSANVEILGEKRDKAVSVPLEALQRKDGQPIVYRLKAGLKPEKVKAATEGLSGRGKFTWLADHWQDYFDAVPVQAGVATLERVEVLSGLQPSDQVSLEDPTKKKVEQDDENN
ncbi:MAG TPA: efflux RND transporter periplasmic adaptor subunit [Holophagaceae bacterium]|nr:efflux RND transporter periplasmic adaptor subunit [Holophagaceae bacterium]